MFVRNVAGSGRAAAIEVAVVDDDPDALAEMEDSISHAGFSARMFSSPRAAFEAVRARTVPTILVADVCMPGMSGLDLVRSLHEDRQSPPLEIVLVSALSGFAEAVEALQWGVIDFLIKPVSLPQLKATLVRASDKIAELLAAEDRQAHLHDWATAIVEQAHAILGGPVAASAPASARPSSDPEAAPMDARRRLAMIKLFQNSRRARDRLFDCCSGGDPCWEIVLFVLEQEALGRSVSVTSACHAASVPQTTAMRKIDELIDRGVLVREADRRDRRRILLKCSAACTEMADAYFRTVHKQMIGTLQIVQ